jgi:hypothetical protein
MTYYAHGDCGGTPLAVSCVRSSAPAQHFPLKLPNESHHKYLLTRYTWNHTASSINFSSHNQLHHTENLIRKQLVSTLNWGHHQLRYENMDAYRK